MLSIKMFCYKVFQLTILLLQLTDVNCQFTLSALSLQHPTSSVGSNATATCNVTYTGSTTTTLTWKINDVSVQIYQIENGQIPLQASPPASGYDTLPSTTTSIVNTSDTFPMNLEIRNVNLTLNQANVTLSCPAPNCIQKVNLQIGVCQPITGNGVIATVSSSPCGFGCTVQYSCASGYTKNDVTATCQEDATFNTIPICTLSLRSKPLSDGAIAGIVIGCIIVVAIIIVVLIALFCKQICCCAFTILCLSWGTKEYTAGRS
uniref:VCRL1 variant A-1 n=1 Tax=Ciona intestinalis TaxID=7719 RepID=I3NN86_CIOIN|nr:vCRL1 variant A-1 [Ciona intestinalis]